MTVPLEKPIPQQALKTPSQLEALLNAQSTPSLLLDRRGSIVWVNQAGEGLFKVGAKQLIGSPLTNWLDSPVDLHTLVTTLIDEPGQAIKIDIALRHTQDSLQAVLNATQSPDASDWPVVVEFVNHAHALLVQASEHKTEQQTIQRGLLRNLAHEIRNPLGGIRGAAQLLAKELSSPALHEYTNVIVAETSRLQTLLDRLLSAQAMPKTLSMVNIHELLERVKQIVSNEFPNQLIWQRDYDVSLPDMLCDEHQIIQVLLNLLRNAAQILIEGGQPEKRIELKTRVLRQVTIGARRHRLALELLVIDNGPGIAQALVPQLFNPLVTGRAGGTGLGLHIAQSFVQAHDGSIEATSQRGRTVFKIVLPIVIQSL
jgi:two-component system, NtrC family, nitrogen regulation sensor histidine kinase GlnL